MGQGSSAMSDAGAAGESEALLPAKDKQDEVAKETGGAEAYKVAIQGEFTTALSRKALLMTDLYHLDVIGPTSSQCHSSLSCWCTDVLAMLGLGHFRISVLAVMTAAAYTGVAMSWYVQPLERPP